MGILKTIAITIILVFVLGAVPAAGRVVYLPAIGPGRLEFPVVISCYQEHVFWAQNDTGENEKTDGSTSGAETKKSESTNKDKSKTSESKSKSLEPFVPSEKIPGEQAVDFPVDI